MPNFAWFVCYYWQLIFVFAFASARCCLFQLFNFFLAASVLWLKLQNVNGFGLNFVVIIAATATATATADAFVFTLVLFVYFPYYAPRKLEFRMRCQRFMRPGILMLVVVPCLKNK